MRKELLRFTLYALIICLTGGALHPAVAAFHPLGRSGTHFCGVINGQRNMQHLDQLPNRHYAQSFPANFNAVDPYTVRLIYFLPNDRAPQRDIDTKLDRLIKDAQQSFAEVMENHGFGRKTFQFEMDTSGNAIVHQMTGQFSDAVYRAKPSWEVWEEVFDTFEGFDPTTEVYLAVIDTGIESLNIDGGTSVFKICGLGGHYGSFAGRALMPASGGCFKASIAAHELGHAFGLYHDRLRNSIRKPPVYHGDTMTSSFCAAEWLDVHRYFNIGKTYPRRDNQTTIQMSPPVASSPNAIHLRFEITDGDGLQQAQLYWDENIIACQSLNGQSDVYEFELSPVLHRISDFIVVRVMDIDGNFIEETYPIDLTALLPVPRTVSIPDPNLATAIRQEVELAPGDTFTQWNLSWLVFLNAASRGIRNLHGLEHATRLSWLILPNNSISDIGLLAGMTSLDRVNLLGNSISDISALAGLTGLGRLNLGENSISDISSLAGLTDMWGLYLGANSISDISPLAGLTRLRELDLGENSISDISVLAGLTHLTKLWLWENSISDISPLVANTGLGSGDTVYLQYNPLSHQSIHTHIPALQSRGVTVEFDQIVVPPKTVNIPDSNLRNAIEKVLGKVSGATITVADMATLTELIATHKDIRDLTGLEAATRLAGLDLRDNPISDISPLAGLTNLQTLRLARNNITDISPVAGLTNLTELNLRANSVSDISPLEGLTKLTSLWINGNSISDLSPLGRLTQLTQLRLDSNSISDLAPLVANMGFGNGDTVNVRGNPLSNLSINTHIPALQNRGVTVAFDDRLERVPDKITGPWLWVIAPTAPGQGGADSNNVDSLAAASNGDVTEAEVAANGAKEGDVVGNYVWTLGKIAETGSNNINNLINAIGMAQGDVNHHSSYALITLESVTAQSNVTMWVGSDDSIKVWLNGEVVHSNPKNRGATDFQDRFTVNLKQGDNLLLVKVSERSGGWSMFVGIEADVNAVYKRPSDPVVSGDVNRDGVVNILDLVVIASQFGRAGQNQAVDVNGDGVVNILDLILVAGRLDGAAAAPAAQSQGSEALTAAVVQGWLIDARSLAVRGPIMKRGIMVLEQLLAALTPREMELLPNYPNPFNPETWIPYRLAEDAVVTLTIYDGAGQVVRAFGVGHQVAAAYEDRSKAVYWDGRNEFGEAVASGVYFYYLSAGDYSATRKMVVLK